MEAAMEHICHKINAAHQSVAAVAHSLKYDASATDRGIQSSPYVLFRIWQPRVLGFANENLRYLVTNAQIDKLGIPPLILQQALQLVALQFRYTVLHTNTIAAKVYNLRCQFRCSNSCTSLPDETSCRTRLRIVC